MLLTIIVLFYSVWLYISLGTNIIHCNIIYPRWRKVEVDYWWSGTSTNGHTTMIGPLKSKVLYYSRPPCSHMRWALGKKQILMHNRIRSKTVQLPILI